MKLLLRGKRRGKGGRDGSRIEETASRVSYLGSLSQRRIVVGGGKGGGGGGRGGGKVGGKDQRVEGSTTELFLPLNPL